jgi:hypothetical protein
MQSKMIDRYVFCTEDGKWSFYDESNMPIGIYYDSIEKAIDALYQYFEVIITN